VGIAAVAVAALFAACGGGSSGDSNEPSGNFQVKVTSASFPSHQAVGQTSLMKIDVTNTGKKTVPTLAVSVEIEGKEGEGAQIPFAIHVPETGLANGDRPVWVLAATYPRLAGSSEPGGATTSGSKTYSFGPLKPGKSVEAVWKLSAVRPGKYTVAYEVGAGLSGEAHAKTASGVAPGGSFVTDISTELPETEVNGAGEIVEVGSGSEGSSSGGTGG
jgi:hypothetical protein